MAPVAVRYRLVCGMNDFITQEKIIVEDRHSTLRDIGQSHTPSNKRTSYKQVVKLFDVPTGPLYVDPDIASTCRQQCISIALDLRNNKTISWHSFANKVRTIDLYLLSV